jgi:RNA polymerase sigma-70 factor (ECF subfamily)
MANYASFSDFELVDLLKSKDHAAFEEIYQRYRSPLFLHAYRMLQDDEEARDIVQELFRTLWAKHATLSIRTTLDAYLYGAIRNRILKFIAHQKVIAKYTDSLDKFLEEGIAFTDEMVREKELIRILESEIASLPPKMREVFELSRNGLLSYKQIAEQLAISDKTVKKQINNAIRILRLKINLILFFGVISHAEFQLLNQKIKINPAETNISSTTKA